MEAEAVCRFHSIGQGLFYNAKIFMPQCGGFCFVYDCGTMYKKDKTALRKAIDSCYACKDGQTAELDALFISHFDLDHISGVPYLLEKCTAKNIFIPYFAPESLKLLALKNADSIEDPEIIRLYADPIAFFAAHGCENIFVLWPQRGRKDQLDDERGVGENTDFGFQGDVVPTGFNESVRIFNCYGKTFFRLFKFDWEFNIYQDQTRAIQKKIQKEIQDLLPMGTDLSSLLLDESLKKAAKKLYSSVKDGINQSSMVLYHAPCKKEGWQTIYAPTYGPEYNVLGTPAGTLLTGDLNLRKLRDGGHPFTQFVVSQSQGIGLFQLPHHGSGGSISVNQVAKIIPHSHVVMVCSYGRNNQFRHPDPYTLDKLMEICGSPIIHVTENRDYDYGVEVPWWAVG